MDAIAFTELRNNLASVMDKAAAEGEPVLITRPRGKSNMVLMSATEFAGWQETVHLLSSARNSESLLRSIAQDRAGEVTRRDLLPTKPDAAQKG